MKILVIGGAGFIGQHLCRALITEGFFVRVLDNFNPQIHSSNTLPLDLINNVELIRGDIRDKDVMLKALDSVEVIVHLAAETGTGQSMYEINKYFSVNVQGTANLLDILQNDLPANRLRTIVLASSRAIYGEGAYKCIDHGVVFPDSRAQERMLAGNFDPVCPFCASSLAVVGTPESAPFKPMSIYGLTWSNHKLTLV